MLIAREERAARQVAALAQFRAPLVSLTIVMPGPVKDGWLARRVMEVALEQTDSLIGAATGLYSRGKSSGGSPAQKRSMSWMKNHKS